MIKWKHKRKILAGLKRDRLSGAFDRLSCSKRERVEWKSIFANQIYVRIEPGRIGDVYEHINIKRHCIGRF